MQIIRRAILAFALMAGIAPVFAQAPPPVPALPDTERRTAYTISTSTCACNVGFALYGDGTDYQNWLEVFVNGVRVNFNDATFGWTITSPTGSLGNIPRPITDGVLTFTNAQSGTIQIVGARRPRRLSTFAENRGVPARDFNQILNDMIAQNREVWDKINDVTGRALLGLPSENIGPLPSAALRAGSLLAFDVNGNPVATTPGVGTGNVVGPGLSVNNDVACWNGTTGALLRDCGAIGTTTLTGDVLGGPAVGTVPTTLATVNANVGSFGTSSALPSITVDGKGRITAASNTTITPANIGAVPSTRNVFGGAGMTSGGALSADLTLGLANIPNNSILANNSGISAAPGNLTTSQILDMLGAVQGDILYRSATGWQALAPGTNGQLLTSGGASANLSWTTASGTGTVTSVGPSTGITTSPNPITGAGTVALTVPVVTANGGTGVVSPTAHTVPINEGASAQNNTGTGSLGQFVASGGASADPTMASGPFTLLATLTASNSATLSDTTHITSGYADYKLVFTNLIPATTGASCQLQVHSGGSFQSTNYVATGFVPNGTAIVSLSTTTTYIPLCNNLSQSNSSPGLTGEVTIFNPSNAVIHPVTALLEYNGSGNSLPWTLTGYWNSSAIIDGIQFTYSTGNIASGTIKIYGRL